MDEKKITERKRKNSLSRRRIKARKNDKDRKEKKE